MASYNDWKRMDIRYGEDRTMNKKQRAKQISSWIDRTLEKRKTRVKLYDDMDDIVNHNKRKIGYLVSGFFAIVFCLFGALFHRATMISNLNFYPVEITCLVLSFVGVFLAIRFYGKWNNIFKAIIVSYFIFTLFYYLILAIYSGTWLMYLLILISTILLYLGYCGLEYIWYKIGDEK